MAPPPRKVQSEQRRQSRTDGKRQIAPVRHITDRKPHQRICTPGSEAPVQECVDIGRSHGFDRSRFDRTANDFGIVRKMRQWLAGRIGQHPDTDACTEQHGEPGKPPEFRLLPRIADTQLARSRENCQDEAGEHQEGDEVDVPTRKRGNDRRIGGRQSLAGADRKENRPHDEQGNDHLGRDRHLATETVIEPARCGFDRQIDQRGLDGAIGLCVHVVSCPGIRGRCEMF